MENIVFKKSFAAKLVLNRETIDKYQQIKDLCATHKKVRTRLCFSKESIYFGKTKIAIMKINRKHITLYLALDPKNYVSDQYRMKDVSDTKDGMHCPTAISIHNKKHLKEALVLLETLLEQVQATDLCVAEDIDYKQVFYERSFEELLQQGLIKKYIRNSNLKSEEITESPIEMCRVHFTAKLLYEATNQAEHLYIITNYTNWDLKQAVLMEKHPDRFTATISFPKNTPLEFKICRSDNWQDVEKGIWKEEIVNHNYILVDQDLEVEDLIYNFRKEH